MNPRNKTVGIVIVITALLLLLSGTFSDLIEFPSIWSPDTPEKPMNPQFDYVFFRITNQTNTSYLRQMVYTTYIDGNWTCEPARYFPYSGDDIDPQLSGLSHVERKSIILEPLRNMSGWIPSFKDMEKANPLTGAWLRLPEYELLFTNGTWAQNVSMDYSVQSYEASSLKGLSVTPDPINLDVPVDMEQDLSDLIDAWNITGMGPYDRCKVIQQMMINITKGYTSNGGSNGTTDGSLAFILGNATVFNSMSISTCFVLLARTAGVPARLVEGFLIDPEASVQNVTTSNIHFYSEVRFDGAGWVVFDITPYAGVPIISEPKPIPPDTYVVQNSSIQGVVFDDRNGDGIMDPGESGAPGVKVELVDDTGNIAMVYTDSTGNYSFERVGLGLYHVRLSDGSLATMPVEGTVEVTVNGSVTGPSFGVKLLPPGLPRGMVFFDKDRDGVRDPYEMGIDNITLRLDDPFNSNRQWFVMSNLGGVYSFPLDDPSGFVLTLLVEDEWTTTTESQVVVGDMGVPSTQVDFGLYQTWIDVSVISRCNCTGGVDGFGGVEGMTVALVDVNGNIVSVENVGESGKATFVGMDDGLNTVILFLKAGWVNLTALSLPIDTNFEHEVIFLVTHPDIGQVGTFHIDGTVFEDRDADGVKGNEDWLLSSALVQMFDSNGTLVQSCLTDRSGNFSFQVNHTFGLEVRLSLGMTWKNTTPATVLVTVADENVSGILFGAWSLRVNGTVFYDLDRDGIQETDEPGVASIYLALYDENDQVLQLTESGPDGNYSFSGLAEGWFTIKVLIESGMFPTIIDAVELYVVQEMTGIDFGVYWVKVRGSVFNDLDGDGWRSSEDPPLGDVIVILASSYDVGHNILNSKPDGSFCFDGVDPGYYWLMVVPGPGWVVTTASNISIWVQMDATYDYEFGVQEIGGVTFTNLDDVDLMVNRSGSFSISGTVVDANGVGMSLLEVWVFLSPDKTVQNGTMCGMAVVSDGRFTAECEAPLSLLVGQYQLIAETQGGNGYLPSTSDPQIRLMDNSTLIIIGPRQCFVNETVKFRFHLMESTSRASVQNALIDVNVPYPDHLTTDEDGMANFTFEMSEPGEQHLSGSYGGSLFLSASKSSLDLEVYPLQIDFPNSILLRGRPNSLIGKVHGGPLLGEGKQVVCYLDDLMLGVDTCDELGIFRIEYPIPSDHVLGACTIRTEVLGVGQMDSEFTVKAETTLSAEWREDLLHISLKDDHGLPLSGRSISMDDSGPDETVRLDTLGTKSMDYSPEGDQNVTLSYRGEDDYLPSSAHVDVPGSGESESTMPLWPFLVVAAAALGVAAYVGYRYMGRRGKEATPSKVKVKPVVVTPLSSSPYTIALPQVEGGLPWVWGEGEPLHFQLSGPSGRVRASIKGIWDSGDIELADRPYQMERTFHNGTFLFTVTGGLGRTEREFRVVNYREEVTNLFKETFQRWRSERPELSDDLGPREIQGKVRDLVGEDRAEALDELILMFEHAEYSLHDIQRKEYLRMWRAYEELRR